MRNYADYQAAGDADFRIQVWIWRSPGLPLRSPACLAALSMGLAAWGIGMAWGFLHLLGVLSGGLLMLAVAATLRPSERANFGLFKYASVYMLAAMILVVIEVL